MSNIHSLKCVCNKYTLHTLNYLHNNNIFLNNGALTDGNPMTKYIVCHRNSNT